MKTFQKYTDDKTTLILISLLKEHGIKKVVASPGTTNMWFVASIQQDPFFEIISAPDERSAAYMACGISAIDYEPVIITCTEATASRNYFPALTEAFYRKLPILAITGCHNIANIGNLHPQIIDRRFYPKDTYIESVHLKSCYSLDDEWEVNLNVNKAILALKKQGGGPVHINLEAGHSLNFNVALLPKTRIINKIQKTNFFPSLPEGKIAVFIGSHRKFTNHETTIIDKFCQSNNAVVFCDHTSNYKGAFRIDIALIAAQKVYKQDIFDFNLLIHIGEISGEQYIQEKIKPKEVWRVSEDGEIRDTFKKLTFIFEISYIHFFQNYTSPNNAQNNHFLFWKNLYNDIYNKIPCLPFSNVWIAQQLHNKLPSNSNLHFSIYNSLRSWNFFEVSKNINCYCNVGGFGIDGTLSSLIGNALIDKEKICFAIVGDLSFFYDINSLANRHIPNNVRIILINNGKGTEFRNYGHPAYHFGEFADDYIAAAKHYGNKSTQLIKHYAEDLGFKYLQASNKDTFIKNISEFTTELRIEQPIIFEVFTNSDDESLAIRYIREINKMPLSFTEKFKRGIKNYIKSANETNC